MIADALKSVNFISTRLALRDLELARAFMSRCLQMYDELAGRGLAGKDPVEFIVEQGWGEFANHERVELPTRLSDNGGTRLEELLYLANVTKVLKPKTIFEIGTYNGRTTSIFIMNAPPDATVITLDLPAATEVRSDSANDYIDTDINLVKRRKLARYVYELGMESRYRQILCDSMEFDPTPYSGTIELGFIDGAHSYEYVKNDTEKVAVMMAERGLVMWHDYGGKGRFKPLSDYLESLAKKIPLYRVPETSLAWAAAKDVRRLAAQL
ncbi:MAG: class I SAM-dependent methyltransferase [Acidobacteria bacterium]|nr:class I SAM-dependent methyltransferase [Acidobacteriota bacterium]